LLPEPNANAIPGSSSRKRNSPPAAAAPSSDSSRRRREAVVPGARQEKDPSLAPSASPKVPNRWLWPLLAGGLVGVVALGGILLLHRRPAVVVAPPEQAVSQPLSPPSAPVALPPQAEAPTRNTLPTASAVPTATEPASASATKASGIASPARHSQRQDHAGRARADRPVRQVRRNRNGIPLLEP
jgi:hypothetical protein